MPLDAQYFVRCAQTRKFRTTVEKPIFTAPPDQAICCDRTNYNADKALESSLGHSNHAGSTSKRVGTAELLFELCCLLTIIVSPSFASLLVKFSKACISMYVMLPHLYRKVSSELIEVYYEIRFASTVCAAVAHS
jgi:hypothetical protein